MTSLRGPLPSIAATILVSVVAQRVRSIPRSRRSTLTGVIGSRPARSTAPAATPRTWSFSPSRAAARGPPHFVRRPRSPAAHGDRWAQGRAGAPARRSGPHHRRVGWELHRAGVRPVRRQAVRHLRDQLPEAQRPGRVDRACHEPWQLGSVGVGGLGPLRTGRAAVRRNPLSWRHIRRSRSWQRTVHLRDGHGHFDGRAHWLQSARFRLSLLWTSMRCRFPALRRHRRPCRSRFRPLRSTTMAAAASSWGQRGSRSSKIPRPRRVPRLAQSDVGRRWRRTRTAFKNHTSTLSTVAWRTISECAAWSSIWRK